MDIDDAALMFEGWGDHMLYGQQTFRRATLLICEVVNKSFGGKGIMKNGHKMWPLPGDDNKKTTDLISLLKKHNELGLKKGKNGKR